MLKSSLRAACVVLLAFSMMGCISIHRGTTTKSYPVPCCDESCSCSQEQAN